jgi:hypothetical protein
VQSRSLPAHKNSIVSRFDETIGAARRTTFGEGRWSRPPDYPQTGSADRPVFLVKPLSAAGHEVAIVDRRGRCRARRKPPSKAIKCTAAKKEAAPEQSFEAA